MKIALVNKSGSVGKTTLAAHLFSGRMPGATFFALESSNLTASEFGIKVRTLDTLQFKQTVREAFHLKHAIFDVGGSKNFTDFHDQMQAGGTGHTNFDFFIIPVIADEKAEKETLDTALSLMKLGVEPEKMRIVYNRVKPLTEFQLIPGLVEKYSIIYATIKDSPLFPSLLTMKMTIADLMAEPRTALDFQTEAAAAKKGSREFDKAYELYFAKDYLPKVAVNLDEAWAALGLGVE